VGIAILHLIWALGLVCVGLGGIRGSLRAVKCRYLFFIQHNTLSSPTTTTITTTSYRPTAKTRNHPLRSQNSIQALWYTEQNHHFTSLHFPLHLFNGRSVSLTPPRQHQQCLLPLQPQTPPPPPIPAQVLVQAQHNSPTRHSRTQCLHRVGGLLRDRGSKVGRRWELKLLTWRRGEGEGTWERRGERKRDEGDRRGIGGRIGEGKGSVRSFLLLLRLVCG
jgi:hypothetical protein